MEGQSDTHTSSSVSNSVDLDQMVTVADQEKQSIPERERHLCSCSCVEGASESLESHESIPCEGCESSANPDIEIDETSILPTKPDDSDKESLRPRKARKVPLANTEDKKPKLRTSKDVYDRLKWDPSSITIKSAKPGESLDLSSIYVGYKDRFLGMCELSLDNFEPGGDIPFHRVYYFRTGGPPVEPFIGNDGEVKVREDNIPEGAVFIWDRESRIDLIFKSGNSTVLKR
ncbi:unnamed protein product [Orchesella dallaii]|uniref:MJ1316 RNA cyclic group end recognition domain-containing protein n=1 Tax=Orchesella dallaii TaxID=48710 RepID=A0ABP1S2K9_9HEXA